MYSNSPTSQLGKSNRWICLKSILGVDYFSSVDIEKNRSDDEFVWRALIYIRNNRKLNIILP